MAETSPIPPQLIGRLRTRLGLSQAAVYRRVERVVNTFHVQRRPAALILASQSGLNISKFATAEDFAAIREVTSPGAATKVSPLKNPEIPYGAEVVFAREVPHDARFPVRRRRAARRAARPAPPRQRGTSVWLVHGRNEKAATELRRFLRSLGLQPLEWNQAVSRTRQGAPYVGTVLSRAFHEAAAVVVLLTPDDEARLRAPYRRASDPHYETHLTGQARPNVLFEAGMAFATNPDSTVLVQLGDVRPFSDIAGRHVVQLEDTPEKRRELATKLANAGCDVDLSGIAWLSEGDFSLDERAPRRRARRRRRAKRPARR